MTLWNSLVISTFLKYLTCLGEPDSSTEKKVLVHCAMGISRSPAMVIAWLMKRNKWNFKDSQNFVKKYRSCIKPNEGFVKQLIIFESEILKSM